LNDNTYNSKNSTFINLNDSSRYIENNKDNKELITIRTDRRKKTKKGESIQSINNMSNSKNSTTINLNESCRNIDNNSQAQIILNRIQKKNNSNIININLDASNRSNISNNMSIVSSNISNSKLSALNRGGLSLTKYLLYKAVDKDIS